MKRRIIRVIALVLVMLVTVTGNVSGVSARTSKAAPDKNSGKYPVSWDLSELYADKEEWNADYDKAMELLDKYDSYRGKLNTAENIYEYICFSQLTELTDIQNKLYTYVLDGLSLDATNSDFSELSSKLDTMESKEKQLNAFAEPEIYSLSLSERKKIFSDPIFKDMKYLVRQYTDPDQVVLSEEENRLLAIVSLGEGYSEEIFNILNNVELPYPMITMPGGTEEELTEQLYEDIISNDDYDDEFKAKANKTLLKRFEGYEYTFATLLEEYCAQEYADAQINGYDSALEFEMDGYELKTDIYDILIDAAHDGLKDYQRYLEAHKKGLELKTQYPFHLGNAISDFDPGKTEYDRAVDEVIEALSVLGEEYTDTFKKIINSGHIDVYATDTKDTGSFEFKYMYDSMPYILLNYNGNTQDISDLAHEMGHAVYDELSSENQPMQYKSPTIFTQEVASLTNELLFYTYKKDNAKDDEEKLYYIEKMLFMFSAYFFTQVLYAEFEDYLYKEVESGRGLNAEDIGDKWVELYETYRGDAVKTYPEARYQWASIPHFYDAYYVYQYGADVCYAASIAERISSGKKDAVKEYLDFLKLGGSAAPADLLNKAGISPESKDTYKFALEYFRGLVDEYERLIDNRLKKQ